MKKIKRIDPKEMEASHGSLMDALRADPDDVTYCVVCDGFRVKDHVCVPLRPLPDR